MNEPQTYTARWVFPVAGPPLPNGTVTVHGDRIEAVSPKGERTPDHNLGNVAIIPGLANAHTHLDLSGAWGQIPPTDPEHFTDWLRGVIAYRRTRTPEQTQDDIRDGLAECLQSGTTLIGDIAVEGVSWDAISSAPVRATVFWELIGLNAERLNQSWARSGMIAGTYWFEEEYPPGLVIKSSTDLCRWAISPHAPYSVHHEVMSAMLTYSPVLATHVGESPGERELLENRSGRFVQFLSDLGLYDEAALANSWASFLTPWRDIDRQRSWLVIHANYLPADFPFGPRHTIVYCPRTHAAFKHPPHPFREFLARGVRVCLGTDSLASNPALDIFAEAQFLHERYPDFPPDQLLRMVTLSGAEALGCADEVGSLEPGKSADFVAIPLPHHDSPDPYELLFASTGTRRTLFRGVWRN